MPSRKRINMWFGLLVIASMLLAACQSQPAVIVETVYVENTPQVIEVVATEEVVIPDTLVICLGQEPDTLYSYGGNMLAMTQVLQAIYDGGQLGYDARSFAYQAVITEKLPSLSDGDATIEVVTANEGDTISDPVGDPITLEPGVLVRPAGCSSADCEITYEGGPLEMDQMVVTFTFLPGLLWSDGTPLTSNDSVYAFNLLADPDTTASKFTIQRTSSYEALDDNTVVWSGLPGYMDATYMLNLWAPMPEHVWGQYTALELIEAEESSRAPIGWGPYVIDEWISGESIRLHKNPNYFRADEGLPYFDNLVFRIVGENSNANIAAILSGECDVVDQTSHLDDQSELLLELQNAGQLNATFVTGTVWEHIDFSFAHFTWDDGYDQAAGDRADFFGDVRTRRAFAMCFDRQAVVDTVMYGQSIVLHSYLPPQHPLFNANVRQYPFDVEAGSALLEEAGWIDEDGDGIREAHGVSNVIDGTPLSVNYWTTSATQRQQATQILAQTAAECGIDVKLEYWDSTEYFARNQDGPLNGRKFDLGQFAWLSGVQPPCDLFITDGIPGDSSAQVKDIPWLYEILGEESADVYPFTAGWGGWNRTAFSDPEYDSVCKTAISALPGQPAYVENHLLVQELFAEKLPTVPLYLRLKLAATRVDMCSFVMDPTANSEFWNIEEFGYGPLCE